MAITLIEKQLETDLADLADAQPVQTDKTNVCKAIVRKALQDTHWLKRKGFCLPESQAEAAAV